MGHIILAEDRLPWWRHLSGRRHPLVFQPDHLTIVRYRKVTKMEVMWVNPNCTIIVCDEYPGGRVEFALLHPADIEEFAALVGGPPPPN